MAEVINTNVFNSDKKFVDFSGLDYFWEKAKADTDSKLAAYTNTTSMTAAIEAAKSAAIADADAKLADFYNKKAVENLLAENSAADQAYAKAYTDALFGSFAFAGTTDIDSLFA